MSLALYILAGIEAGAAVIFALARDRHGCYLHPRATAALNLIACAWAVFAAYERGAGTWGGLSFAAGAILFARWTFMAAGDSWAAWSVAREMGKREASSGKAGGK